MNEWQWGAILDEWESFVIESSVRRFRTSAAWFIIALFFLALVTLAIVGVNTLLDA